MESPVAEVYISVDVETAGPNPGGYSLLSIGACLVSDPSRTYYVELQPNQDAFTPDALQVSGLDLKKLKEDGLPPEQAMRQFEAWVLQVIPPGSRPVFVAFNAPFDWMFVNDYFHRYLGHTPFGHTAIDIKAFYMGLQGVTWEETGFDQVAQQIGVHHPLTHHALQDAIDQAKIFHKMLAKVKRV